MELSPPQRRRLTRALWIVVAGAAAADLALAFSLFRARPATHTTGPLPLSAPLPTEENPSPAASPPDPSDYAAIWSRNVSFDFRPPPPPSEPAAPDEDPKITLAALLWENRRPLAVLEEESGRRILLQPGQHKEGLTLIEVSDGEVVVNHKGRQLTLAVEPPERPAQLHRVAQAPSSSESKRQAPARVPDPGPPPIELPAGAEDQFLESLTLEPLWAEGSSLMGLRIAGVRAGSPFAEAGAREGDVIRAIDSEPIRERADLARLYDRLVGAEPFLLSIVRGSETYRLRFSPSPEKSRAFGGPP